MRRVPTMAVGRGPGACPGGAQQFHPDKFVGTQGQMVKRAVYAVYKRMTEAYNVLSDPQQRWHYEQGLPHGKHRLDSEHRSRRLDAEERQLGNQFARLYLRSAKVKMEAGDHHGAWIDIELGLSLDDAQPLKDLHVQAIKAMTGRS